MSNLHQEWKNFPRQLYNPRRWQPSARKIHRQDIDEFLNSHNYFNTDSSPEARGVNVTSLMQNLGITLNWQWPPKHDLENESYKNNLVYLVSLAGHLIHSHR
jgi:hypothetical protein